MEELVAKYISGNASEEEKRQVEAWRNENPDTFFAYKKLWTGLPEAYELPAKPKVVAWYQSQYFRVAAAFLVVAFSLTFIIGQLIDKPLETPVLSSNVLPDGSKVYLYKNATVEFGDFKNERKVKINGRVFFEVKENSAKPFLVVTDQGLVKVTGTSFQVSTEQTATTEVIVETGSVEFSFNPDFNDDIRTVVKLNPGEKAMITPMAKGLVRQNNRNKNYRSWVNHEMDFERERLKNISNLIYEVYDYNFEFKNRTIANCVWTAQIKNKSPEQIAKILSETFGFTYEIAENRTIIFDGVSCQ